jgi:hypothetical protein
MRGIRSLIINKPAELFQVLPRQSEPTALSRQEEVPCQGVNFVRIKKIIFLLDVKSFHVDAQLD